MHEFSDISWVKDITVGFVIIQGVCRGMVEVLFRIAASCGKIESPKAAIVGKICWQLAKAIQPLGFGTSKKYLKAKYIERGPKYKV